MPRRRHLDKAADEPYSGVAAPDAILPELRRPDGGKDCIRRTSSRACEDPLMSIAALLGLLFRWLHILAGMTAVGGTVFSRFVVLPSHGVLSDADRELLHAQMRRRWSKIVMAAIGFLLVSGLYNYILIVENYRDVLPKWYHMLFGIKFILALIVFAVASLLCGRTALAQRIRTKARFWMSLNILLAVVIVCISGILRTAHPPGSPVFGAEAMNTPTPR